MSDVKFPQFLRTEDRFAHVAIMADDEAGPTYGMSRLLDLLHREGYNITEEQLVTSQNVSPRLTNEEVDAIVADAEAGAPVKKREPRAKWDRWTTPEEKSLYDKKKTTLGWVRKNKGYRDTETNNENYVRYVEECCEHQDFVRALLVAVNYHYAVEEEVKTSQDAVEVLKKFWLK